MKKIIAILLLLCLTLTACGHDVPGAKVWEAEAFFDPQSASGDRSQILCDAEADSRTHLVIAFVSTSGPSAFDIHVEFTYPTNEGSPLTDDFSLTKQEARAISLPQGASYKITATATSGVAGNAVFQLSLS